MEIPAELRRKLKEDARSGGGGGDFGSEFSPLRIDLGGSKTIVDPGKERVLRLLPRWDGDRNKPMYVEAWQHWIVTQKGASVPVYCLERTYGKKCPVCKAIKIGQKSRDKREREAVRKMAPKKVYLFNACIGRTGRRRMEGKRVFLGWVVLTDSMFQMVSDLMTGGSTRSAALGDITDPREGYDLRFIRPTKGKGQRWDIRPMPRPTPLFTKEDAPAFKNYAARLLNLEEVLESEKRDDLEDEIGLYGDDDESPRNKKGGAMRKKGRRVEEEEELEDDEDLDEDLDEDEEEEPDDDEDDDEDEDEPRRSKKSVKKPAKKKSRRDEDDEEEEDDDLEDEDEDGDEDEDADDEPRRSKKPAKKKSRRDEDEDDEDEEDEDDEPAEDEDEEDDDDESEDEDDEDEDEPRRSKKPVKKGKPAPAKKKSRRDEEEDEDDEDDDDLEDMLPDDDEDDEDEDAPPKKRGRGRPPGSKNKPKEAPPSSKKKPKPARK